MPQEINILSSTELTQLQLDFFYDENYFVIEKSGSTIRVVEVGIEKVIYTENLVVAEYASTTVFVVKAVSNDRILSKEYTADELYESEAAALDDIPVSEQ